MFVFEGGDNMSDTHYKTYQIWTKKGHRLFPYLQQMCQNAKNLYNMNNFYIRQIYTAFRQENRRQPLQQEVLDTLQQHVGVMNERQLQAYQSKLAKEQQKPVDERKEVRCNAFDLPSEESPFVDYHFLDSLFKVMGQTDYRALPTQCSQWVMKGVFQNWSSFFASLKDYRLHPEKYTGKPRIPSYCRAQEKEVQFTNQDCVIKAGKFLKFPKTKQQLNIGKLGTTEGKLKQVRVIPRHRQYVVELIFECPLETAALDKDRYMSIDLGIDNLATLVTTTGIRPVLVKGKHIKAINQYYNKMKAYYTGILRHGKHPKEGQHTSKRLERLHHIRHRKTKDLFHKASYRIVQLAVEQNIGTIIIGLNQGWKQGVNIGKGTTKPFVISRIRC